ncbi:MAG: uracil phosphoribosyltransferase [Cytophagales bacterium]|nr:uracil phosphoribosyltransferase [Bernardetiaceae bacterium]MDW8210933.1 uracil phosphoribosyltransferase [Cytophagales bacterium]
MFILAQQNSLAHHFIAELRDIRIQKDSMRFRRNLERVGEILAYEISKTMSYRWCTVETPLGVAHMKELECQPVLAPVLRAGLPFYQGFLNFFDRASSAFIGAFRGPHAEDFTFEIQMHYLAAPDLKGKELILIDPMLATGKSIVAAMQSLESCGKPSQTHVAAVIASRKGIEYVQQRLPDCRIWIGDLDEELNAQYYIVPGLGDAGDLAFGTKISS